MNTLARVSALLILSLLAASCSDEQARPRGPGRLPLGPVEVGVIELQSQAVPRSLELPGRVVPSATAEVRPQVNGIVRKIAFQEGGDVKAGDVLYELDDTKFKAAYAAAAAALKKAEAAAAGAQATFDRTEKLAGTNAVSAQKLDDTRSAMLQSEADQEAARADLEAARINLDNTVIRAPIGGVVGVSRVSVGALVTENQGDAMATIRQINPIYVDLVHSSATLLNARDEMQAGRLGTEAAAQNAISLTLENGKEYERKGTFSLAEMVVSQTTGTFTIRATFPNPDRILIPGMFVRATVDRGAVPNAFLVPQRALSRDDAGDATIYVVADGKAELRKVTTGGSHGNDWIVLGGVESGDFLIVDGFQKITNGMEVKVVEAVINPNGVVEQELKQQPAAAGGRRPGAMQ